MVVRLRLKALREERGLRRAELQRLTGLGEARLAALERDDWIRITRREIELLCGPLDSTLDELFEVYAEDCFSGARRIGKLTIHLAANSQGVTSAAGPSNAVLDRLFASSWDLRAFERVAQHGQSLGIKEVRLHQHMPRAPGSGASERSIDEPGGHCFLGSPLTADVSELVVSRLYGVPPYDDTHRGRFPYNFVWHPQRSQKSSFGVASPAGTGEAGIVRTGSGEIVARNTRVESGEGEDCGLVISYRFPGPRRLDDRCILVLAGHSGVGTLACAHAVTDPKLAHEFYPAWAGVPCMRVVKATYRRAPSRLAQQFDNRELYSFEVLPAG